MVGFGDRVDRDEVHYVLAKSLRMVDFTEAEPPRSMKIVLRTTLVGQSAAMKELESTRGDRFGPRTIPTANKRSAATGWSALSIASPARALLISSAAKV